MSISDEEVEAALAAFYASRGGSDNAYIRANFTEDMRAALTAAAKVRANSEGDGEVVTVTVTDTDTARQLLSVLKTLDARGFTQATIRLMQNAITDADAALASINGGRENG